MNGHARPLSYPNHLNYDTRNNSPRRDRRPSGVGQRQPYGHVPLPHEWQPHFNGAPQLDFTVAPVSGVNNLPQISPGSSGYACVLDTLSAAGGSNLSAADNVLIVGQEGAVEVHKIGKNTCNTKFGAITGLKGSVIGAKILPWTARDDPYGSLRPLIALVIHGPILEEARNNISGSSSAAGTDDQGSSSESPSRPEKVCMPPSNTNNFLNTDLLKTYAEPTHYQTTVEVYSLKDHKHVATLYKSTPTPVVDPFNSRVFEPPPPVGDLRVDANGKFVIVASGISGEILIYALSKPEKPGDEQLQPFRCIGKVWTQLVTREVGSVSGANSAVDAGSQNGEAVEHYGVPLYSLSQRWLAVVPPTASSPYSIEGTVLTSAAHPKPPGFSNRKAPPHPNLTTALDMPESETFQERTLRGAVQTFIRVGRKASDTGKEAWNNYWNKNPQNGLAVPAKGEPEAYFPPTHGQNFSQPVPSNEPTPISILDLQKLLDAENSKSRSALVPIGTFPAPEGCSYLSFAPNGLMLLTVTKKGDHQLVWDLKHLAHSASDPTKKWTLPQPHVRQVFRITRWTEAAVVDIVWQEPRGERLAVLTDRGTIHFHELPAVAFTWPPPRRTRRPDDRGLEVPTIGEDPKMGWAINSMTSAVSTGMGKLNSFRTRSVSGSSGLPILGSLALTPAAVGRQGGKVIKDGLSKSLGAASDGYSKYRHAGENKLHLSAAVVASGITSGLVRWMTGKDVNTVAIMDSGQLKLYRIGHAPAAGTKEKSKGLTRIVVTKGEPAIFDIPFIPEIIVPPAVQTLLNPRVGEEVPADKTIEGFWPQPRANAVREEVSNLGHWEAEIEYQTYSQRPFFHQDRRVSLHGFTEQHLSTEGSEAGSVDEPWAFGTKLDSVRFDISRHTEFVDEVDSGGNATGESSLVVEQVVITTRRRRKARSDGAGEEGFFEDECEVVDYAG